MKKIISVVVVGILIVSISYILIPKKVHIVANAEVEVRTLDKKIEMAEVIIIGKIKKKNASKMSNEGFKKKDARNIPQTDYVVSIESVLTSKKPYNDKEVIVRIDGGEVGETYMDTDYMPTFKIGEEALLFLDIDTTSDIAKLDENYYVMSSQEKYDKIDDNTFQYHNEKLSLKDLSDNLKLANK